MENKGLIIVLVVFSSFLCRKTSAQVFFLGGCPSTSAVTSFDVNRYLGLWYEIRSYPSIFQFGSTCTQAEYSLNPNGTVQVLNKALQFGNKINILGNAAIAEPGVGKLIVNFPSTGAPQTTRPNYIILGTDYSNFAVVHSCTSLIFSNIQFAWVLSRQRTLTSQQEATVAEILRSNGVSMKKFGNTNQLNCPVL